MNQVPQLYGDGVQDDTAAIQARLDSGISCVHLPPPQDHYMISRPLMLGSDQEFRLDRFTRIRLAPHSDCVMITNRDHENGNRHCALTGGIWDFDNLNQGPNFMLRHISDPSLPPIWEEPELQWDPRRYRAEAIYFQRVTDTVVRGITIRNPGTYAIQFCKLSCFIIDDVEFDFSTWNPAKGNMDGIHLDGGCHHGKISNIRGTCFDDMVALNANDGCCACEEGPITDIDIDGIYCEYCHSAVRLLSTGAELKRITIRNIHGNFYRYGVGLTHFFANRTTRGVFDDIVIDSCFMAKARQPEDLGWELLPIFPMIFCDAKLDIGKLSISRLCREESTLPEASVEIMPNCHIGNLSICDCKQVNRLEKTMPFLWNKGTVDHLTFQNNELVAAPGGNIAIQSESNNDNPAK